MEANDVIHFSPIDPHYIVCEPGGWVGGDYRTTVDAREVTCPKCLTALFGSRRKQT